MKKGLSTGIEEKYLTKELLDELFIFTPEGVLYWKNPRPGLDKTKPAGTTVHGYRSVKINKRSYRIHRIIWFYYYGKVPTMIDHINGDKSDNRLENLRECNYHQNNCNARKKTLASSHYKGVTIERKNKYKRWRAQIRVNNVNYFLGNYHTEKEAAVAYDEAARKYHGEFAVTNFTI